MRRTTRVTENRRDRMELAAEAGYSKVSFGSVLAGVLVAYGAFAILAALAGGILNVFGVDTRSLTDNDWRQLGIGTGVAAGISLLLSYLFGGYVAGRMARRAGALNGLLVFVLGILVAAGVGAAVGTQADGHAVLSNLRSIGVPTSSNEWSAIGTFAGVGALAAMLVGSVFGGIAGERWHGKLVRRALDPALGPNAIVEGGHHPVDLRDDERPVADSTGRNDETQRTDRTDGAHFAGDDADGHAAADGDATMPVARGEVSPAAADDAEVTRTLR